jgi:2-polyprenyl-3-methyl-5-hydroxy-6-metoxy-1,4-benzoquinol methylase
MRTGKLMSEQYDKQYYTGHCRDAEDFVRHGVADPYRIALQLLAPQNGERILDIGCGRGEIVAACAKRGALAVGIDYAHEATRIARGNENRFVVRADATVLPFRQEAFDKISCMELIEHLEPARLDVCLREVVRILKRGGVLLITTPNAWSTVLHGIAMVANKLGIRNTWMSRDDPYHSNIQNPWTVRTMLKRHGLVVELFPRLPFPQGTPLKERFKRRLLFLFSHVRCRAYKR